MEGLRVKSSFDARTAVLTLAAVLLACTVVQDPGQEFRGADRPRLVTPDDVAARVIDARELRSHIAYLAADAMRGRQTPSPELERAADFIAGRFRDYGLVPAGDGGGYTQSWPFDRVALSRDDVALSWTAGGRSTSLEYGRDYAALAGRGGGEGAIVFLGRAEDAPDSIDAAAGRVAVVLLAGRRPDQWRWPITGRRVALTAARAGAHAVIFVLEEDFALGLPALAASLESPTAEEQPLPLFFLHRDAARALLAAGGGDLAALERATDAGRRSPVRLERARVRARAPAGQIAVRVPNVVAVLPGADTARAEEYVILTAHFDHIGMGPPDESGDSIYNGADDNASGTAALIEIAQAFAALPTRPPRPILFLATSGEEHGLLGARWFASNPSVFLTEAVANLNMDMVGRNHPDSVTVVGHAFSSLGPLLDRIATGTPSLGLTVVPDPAPEENLFQRSDHYPFAQRGIPAVGISSFLHDDYHRPSDETRAIDEDKAARIARLIFLAAYEVAAAEGEPAWTEAGRAAIR